MDSYIVPVIKLLKIIPGSFSTSWEVYRPRHGSPLGAHQLIKHYYQICPHGFLFILLGEELSVLLLSKGHYGNTVGYEGQDKANGGSTV